MDGELWLVGGCDALATDVATVIVYSPARDEWRAAPPLREARNQAVAAVREPRARAGRQVVSVRGGGG